MTSLCERESPHVRSLIAGRVRLKKAVRNHGVGFFLFSRLLGRIYTIQKRALRRLPEQRSLSWLPQG
jgi:hypothetical protein